MAGAERSRDELEELLERILEEKRRGGSPDIEEIARHHPEFAAEIENLLPALEMLERASDRVSADDPASVASAPPGERSGNALDNRIPSDHGPGDCTASLSRTLERLAGRTLPSQRYQVKDEIGRGGQGAVFAVWDEDLQRSLAMKVTLGPKRKGSSTSEQRSLGRFLDEAQVTAQLDHPGIVPVHELGVDAQGGVYFTMKLVQGRDLRTILELVRRGEEGWSRTRALGVLLKVCEAMAYAHSKGVIHRDLKPSNVMVGGFGEVYVMDWGLARILGPEDHRDIGIQLATAGAPEVERTGSESERDSPLVTMEGDVLGTPAYMSPEQARGELQAINRQSDVYSLGAMLYHLLAGHMPCVPPGEHASNRAILARVQRGPPEVLDRSAPAELVSICEKAMAREASARYADMGAVADDLRAFLENRVVAAHRTGAMVELRKWVGRNRALAGSIAAAILAVVAGLVGSLVLKNEAESQAEIAQAVTEFLTEDLLTKVGPVRRGIPNARGLGLDVSMRDVLDEASRRIDKESAEGGRFADKPLVEAAIRACLGETYFDIDVPAEAERHLERALQLQLEELGEEHSDTVKSMRTLGCQYMEYGRLDEARPLVNRAYELSRRVLGAHDRFTIYTQCAVGLVHEKMGEYEEAERIFRAELEECRKHLGEGDVLTLGAMEGLGRMADRLGRWSEAETAYLQCVELQRKFLGEEDLETLSTRMNLGLLYRGRGRLDEAAAQLEIASEGLHRAWPAYDVAVRALAGLAALRKDQGRLAEAREAMTRALELRARRARGPEGPASEKNEYAWELLTCEPAELQDPATALAFALETNELTKHTNPSYLDTLALAYHRTGEIEHALETQRRALALLPPGESPLRTGLEARLAEFEAARTNERVSK